MEFGDAVRRRRMVREYLPDPVDPGAVARILDTARRAPTAGHAQGVSFVVVTAAPRRAELAALAGEEAHVAAGRSPWISVAPVVVVPVVEPDAYRRRYAEHDKSAAIAPDDWPVPYWWVDAGAALMALLLAAVDEGLAAGFLGAHAVPGLATAVGLPASHLPLGIVTLGRPAPAGPVGSARRPRRLADDVIRREDWSGASS
jgi:nitroreductase